MERPSGDERNETNEPQATEAEDEPRQSDLLSIGLLVFFVSLIGIVGALLLVPVLF
jgi:hypothetical protein